MKIGLTVGVNGDELVFRIGLDILKFAAEESETFNPYSVEKQDFVRAFKVTDAKRFAEGVAHFLCEEAEDGSTVITRALEHGFVHAIEGDYGVDEVTTGEGGSK